ncbi:FkbM family methyltransferase [Maribius pontilimi]|uniref:FkbM family methyltransferase n=1 Tax=Palleronia pontilimi TaxID=1964209 RepID=A0A934IH65_9RHOB|nr:FkbM family methyltransferase [Palleronia pontilimi]MBJ3763017.1 FkbM family methyltransferase [Palleronia pontilimi]
MAGQAQHYFDADRLVDLLRPARKTRVVDVGANPINDNPYANLRDAGHCHVWGFEPDPRAYERLTSKPDETYLPHAVGDGQRRKLHVTRMPSLTSLLEPNPPAHAYLQRMSKPITVEQEIEFDTVRLDDLDEPDDFDLLKIDVQGGELLVYDGAAQRLSTVCAVITEVGFLPIYKHQPLLDSQMAALRGHGLMLHKFLFLKGLSLRGGLATRLDKRRHRNQLIDGDAIFIRDLLEPDAVDDEKLKHLAILADGVLESFDLAVRCLDLLIARGRVAQEAAERYVDLLPMLGEPARARSA